MYSVKLYGHTADDREKFCKDLAVLLAIELETARDLLDGVPSVIGRGRVKQDADHLRDRVAMIRGLCLVEEEEGEEIPEQESAGLAEAQRIEADAAEAAKRDTWLSRVWFTILVGLIAISAIVGTVVFVVQWIGMYKTNREATVAPKKTSAPPTETVQQEAIDPQAEQQEIENEISALETKIGQLQFQAKWQNEQLDALYSGRPLDHEEIRRMKVRVALTEQEIRAAGQALKRLKNKLSGM